MFRDLGGDLNRNINEGLRIKQQVGAIYLSFTFFYLLSLCSVLHTVPGLFLHLLFVPHPLSPKPLNKIQIAT